MWRRFVDWITKAERCATCNHPHSAHYFSHFLNKQRCIVDMYNDIDEECECEGYTWKQ